MRIHDVMVFVSDMKRSVAFYRDLLGLKYADPDGLVFSVGEDRPPGR